MKLITKAYEKRNDEDLERYYLIDRAKMNKENFATFEQWKGLVTPPKVEKVDIPKDLLVQKILAVGK